jgi:hypothetical protein
MGAGDALPGGVLVAVGRAGHRAILPSSREIVAEFFRRLEDLTDDVGCGVGEPAGIGVDAAGRDVIEMGNNGRGVLPGRFEQLVEMGGPIFEVLGAGFDARLEGLGEAADVGLQDGEGGLKFGGDGATARTGREWNPGQNPGMSRVSL